MQGSFKLLYIPHTYTKAALGKNLSASKRKKIKLSFCLFLVLILYVSFIRSSNCGFTSYLVT